MPILQVKLSPPQTPETHARLAETLSRLTAQLLGKRHEVTADISITAGTNSEAEKAQFIAAVHAEMQREIGAGKPLAEGSYIAVHELPATDWGYAGQTQHGRRLARARQAEPALQAK